MIDKLKLWLRPANWLRLIRRFPPVSMTPTTTLFASVTLILFGFVSTINAQSVPGHNRTDKVMAGLAVAFEGEEKKVATHPVTSAPLTIDGELDMAIEEVAHIFGVHLTTRVLSGELSGQGGEIVVPYETLFVEGSATPLKSTEALLRQIVELIKTEEEEGKQLSLKLSVQARLHADSAQSVRWVSALAAQISYFGVPMDRFSVALVDGPQDVVTFGFDVQPGERMPLDLESQT